MFIICADNSPYGKKAQMEKDVTCNSDNLCTIKQSVTLVKKTDVQSSWINRFKKAALLENKTAETPSSSGLACPEFRLDPNSAGTHLKLTRCNFGLRSFPVTVRHDYIMRRKNNSAFFSVQKRHFSSAAGGLCRGHDDTQLELKSYTLNKFVISY